MHGSIYLYIKTEGELQKKVHGWMWTTFGMFLVLYLLVTVVTLTTIPASREKYERMPWLWIVVVLNILAIANIPRAIYMNRPIYAFLSSSATIVAFTFLFGTALFPNLVVSTLQPPDPALGSWNLDVYNSASSESTLWLMAVIAFVGLPFVLSYTFTIYWVFRGKVRLDRLTY
jgi:cytochrome d ubiquinol oxidase subunit II